MEVEQGLLTGPRGRQDPLPFAQPKPSIEFGLTHLHHFIGNHNIPELNTIHSSAQPTALFYISTIVVLYLFGMAVIMVHYMNSAYGNWAWTLSDLWDEFRPTYLTQCFHPEVRQQSSRQAAPDVGPEDAKDSRQLRSEGTPNKPGNGCHEKSQLSDKAHEDEEQLEGCDGEEVEEEEALEVEQCRKLRSKMCQNKAHGAVSAIFNSVTMEVKVTQDRSKGGGKQFEGKSDKAESVLINIVDHDGKVGSGSLAAERAEDAADTILAKRDDKTSSGTLLV